MGFDPDLVIPVGRCAKHAYQIGNRDLVQEAELLGDISKTATSRHGVGLIELLKDFLEKGLKYKRNDDLHIAIPGADGGIDLVLKSKARLFCCSASNGRPIRWA